jgi:group II intron reverse transcriptase/maturase
LEKTKPFNIPKRLFVTAFNHVKANAGAAGVDQESLRDFEKNLKDNLYKLWNRMSSGSYFPTPVKAVPIAKKTGGERILGVPTVSDRVAQMVVKLLIEPEIEPYFLADSYGYRPNKSALDAVGITRQRCWEYDWVIEFDIKGLFDNIPHDLLMKAVCKHVSDEWILLYIKRWLIVPIQMPNGHLQDRNCGVPQGSVIGPILSNLFLHYVLDKWMQRHYPNTPWCRYADDGLAHCRTEEEAQELLCALNERFAECGLTLHPDKTKIVYCKDGSRKGTYPTTSFDFLGYTFRARTCKNSKRNTLFVNFTPAVSKAALKSMRATTRKCNVRNRTDLNLQDIARWYNPVLQGWLSYYGKYSKSALYPVCRHFNMTLVAWVTRKYRRFRHRKVWAAKFLEKIAEENPKLFVHWRNGMKGAFA